MSPKFHATELFLHIDENRPTRQDWEPTDADLREAFAFHNAERLDSALRSQGYTLTQSELSAVVEKLA
jgi:hypothetical protein